VTWLTVLGAVSFGALMLFVRRIPQPQAYHDFADGRRLLPRIPNTLDVLSNAPFIILGLAGLAVLPGAAFVSPLEQRAAVVFFSGTILTGIGSLIYHLRPEDRTLAYDRLGIVVAFMGFLAMLVHERVGGAPWLLPAFLLAGVASVGWWRFFDDLRPYGWVQFFPIVAVVAIVVAEKPRYSGEGLALIVIAACYALAKVCELQDRPIYRLLRRRVSGHTLKHIAAAAGVLAAVIWMAARRVLSL
jgi:hypothetical protein